MTTKQGFAAVTGGSGKRELADGALDIQMGWLFIFVLVLLAASVAWGAQDEKVAQLAKEVGNKGWIVYAARGDNGMWDLFLMRPDGSQRRNITNTPDYEEGGPRFSPDGKKLLYRRFAKGTEINHDLWGFQGNLMIANRDGSNPVQIGGDREYPWASWSPDGKRIACLTIAGIQIVDLETKKIVRELPRQGIYQQLYWSPDGRWLCGVANTSMMWTIVRMNVESGAMNVVHEFQSCTPDWFPDSKRIIYPSRPAGQPGNNGWGFTQLWYSDGEGREAKMIYGEDDYHIYGGALSPDGKYVLFTRCPQDGGGSEQSGAPICVMRMNDAPAIAGTSVELRKMHPEAKDAPVLQLVSGWEPCWTYAEIGVQK
jgi:Tol biopolymer transport system component